MRSFTDVFIKHPVLALVVNLVILLVGWRALTNLPVQQYPKIESSSVVITTVYTGASAETVRGLPRTVRGPVRTSVSGPFFSTDVVLNSIAVFCSAPRFSGPSILPWIS